MVHQPPFAPCHPPPVGGRESAKQRLWNCPTSARPGRHRPAPNPLTNPYNVATHGGEHHYSPWCNGNTPGFGPGIPGSNPGGLGFEIRQSSNRKQGLSTQRPNPDPPLDSPASPGVQAIVLAAGKGTRMGGDRPKVAYPVAGHPMVWWVVNACRDASVERCVVVIGYRGQDVRQALADQDQAGCVFVEQHEQHGTGHATQMAQPLFEGQPPTDVFVLPGDGPLIRGETLSRVLSTHRASNAAATVTTAVLDDPTGYGRVLRHPDGSYQAIVEQKDATDQQRLVREINTGYYCFRSDLLFEALGKVRNANAQKEYYLTDVPGLLKQAGKKIAIVEVANPDEIRGVNDPQQLAEVDRILQARLAGPSPNNQARESA